MRRYILTLLLSISFTAFAFAQSEVEAFDKYADAARQTWGVPGMSLVVVKDGKVVLAKGYGTKELGKDEPVDTQTLFGAMSTTKAMTAVAMAILFDEGKVSPDDRVIKHLPDFRLGDPYITQELLIRDLFTHNTGIASTDFLWALTPELPADEAVKRMQFARPSYSLRSGFAYQNSMYLVAGKVIEKASGMTWERFMNERVFGPLGMKNTFPTLVSAMSFANRSKAHYKIKGKIEVIPEMMIDSVAPAGSVWSNADDISKWLNFLFTGAAADGKPILKPDTLELLFRPQVILPQTFYPAFRIIKPSFTTYAYGWFQHDYRGEKVDLHTGSIAGRTAIVGLLRSKKVGIYVFGNIDHVEVRHALLYKALDVFGFGDNSRDWGTELKQLYDGIEAENEKRIATQLAARLPNTKPSLPLGAYVGSYSDPFFGTIEIKLVDGGLRATVARDLSADLVHRHVDVFNVVWSKPWMGESILTFQLNPVSGEVVGLTGFGGQTYRKQPNRSR